MGTHTYHHDNANLEQILAMQALDFPEKTVKCPAKSFKCLGTWAVMQCISLEKPLKSCKIQGNWAIMQGKSWTNPKQSAKDHENPTKSYGVCKFLASNRQKPMKILFLGTALWPACNANSACARELTVTKCNDILPIRECRSLDSPRIIVRYPHHFLERSATYPYSEAPIVAQKYLGEFRHVMALHTYIKRSGGNEYVLK